MRWLIILLLAINLHAQVAFSGASSISGTTSVVTNGQYMAVIGSNKYLTNTQTGHPVFLLGEDGWGACTQLNTADMNQYFADRASRGMNAIWMALADNAYQNSPQNNYYGNVPFSGGDFLGMSSETSYWAHIDTCVQYAQINGITVFMAPAFVGKDSSSGYVSSYGSASCGTLTSYGNFLGTRYAKYSNIVWTLGGDWDSAVVSTAQMNCLASGIYADDANHLITAEACRATCSAGSNKSTLDVWNQATPMSINWVYTNYANIVSNCSSNYARSGAITTIDGEDYYENDDSMTALNIREEGYWAVLSGCTAGRLFGNDPMWCFNSTNANATCYNTVTWQNQLASGGSTSWQQEGYLMRSRKFWLMVPDSSNTVLTGGIGSGSTISVASCTSDNQTCIVYDPIGNSQAPQIAMAHWSGTVHAYWFNPSSGAVTDLSTFSNSGTHTFTPSDGNDWTLVLDLNSASLCSPGSCVS